MFKIILKSESVHEPLTTGQVWFCNSFSLLCCVKSLVSFFALNSLSLTIRLKTSQNLATVLDLAIVAKRSFKNCVYFIYISSLKDSLKKLQANTRLKLLTTLNMLCKQRLGENREKNFLQKTPFLFISENENSYELDQQLDMLAYFFCCINCVLCLAFHFMH